VCLARNYIKARGPLPDIAVKTVNPPTTAATGINTSIGLNPTLDANPSEISSIPPRKTFHKRRGDSFFIFLR